MRQHAEKKKRPDIWGVRRSIKNEHNPKIAHAIHNAWRNPAILQCHGEKNQKQLMEKIQQNRHGKQN